MTDMISQDKRIARLYEGVPEERLERFIAFRQRYPYQTITVQEIPWQVIDTRVGEQVLFLPASGTGVAEVSWETIEHLAQTYRVVAVDYPAVDSLSRLFEGLIGVFDHLGIGQFAALGGSGGALFLQPFLRAYPERISKMILATPVPPDPARGQRTAKLLRWLRVMPTFVIRALLAQSFERLGAGDENLELVMAITREVVMYRLKRKNFMSIFSYVVDMTGEYKYSPDDLKNWSGKLLLIYGVDDSSTPEDVRAQMQALYPQAQVELIEGGGHGIALSHQEEYFAAIDAFLAE